METPLSDKGHKSVLHKMVSSSPVLDTLTDYEAACKHLATGTPAHSIVQEIQKSGSSSASLQELLSILTLKEGDVDAQWAERCRKSAHFEAAAKVLENTFERLEILSGCGELLWAGHFLAALTLGGHSLESDKISIDGDVLLQGARAIPATPSGKFVRPDQCIGVPKVCISPEWQALCAGKAILPLDIMEYKRDTAIAKITKHCYKLLYAAIVCAYHQLDLHDAVMSEPPAPSQFSAAIPLTLATIMHGNHFHMACVWYAKGVGLRWGVLYDRRINNVLELKRCFLLRHEAINIVIRFGELLRSFDLTSKRSPRRDVWWRRFCVCGTKDNEERYVQCSTCLNWFHPKCVELTKIPRGDVPWHCPAHPPKLQAEAEPRENHGSRDGGGGTVTSASSSLHPKPVRQLFKNSKSEVWLCQSTVNGREQQVVLKLVDTWERAMEEARILKQLRGVPNVAQLLDVIQHSSPNGPSRMGLVMEYYPSSDDWISSAQLSSDRTFGRYTRQLLQAVNDIHERGVVHYDISPSNVMFTTGAQHGEEVEEGSTVLLDFGSALAEQPRGARWYQRSNWGTAGFVAPEVVAFGKCSHKIDVWSAGALIAFQLLGVWPQTNKETETVAQMTFDQVKVWAQNNPQRWSSAPTPYLTPSRWELVRRMLALNPAQRLDASSALEQFDALWSRPSPAAGKQDSPTSK